MAKVLVTGGLGYIGSHTVVELINQGHQVSIVDNLCNSKLFILDRIEKITCKKPTFYNFDIKDSTLVLDFFSKHSFDAIVHFAAYKAVGESLEKPLMYYQNNLGTLFNLLEATKLHKIDNFIFSSSCTVYGQADKMPITEDFPWKTAESPYAKTKQMCEEVLMDFVKANGNKVCALRYFNPIGAHSSALIGELPIGHPNNLVPYITQTAVGIRKELQVFGNDYPTKDGTAVRDYIYVGDLAKAHVSALDLMLNSSDSDYKIYNLGTEKGNTVLEVIHAFERANKLALPYKIVERRKGDIAIAYANCTKAEKELNWKVQFSLEESLKTAWAWQKTL